MYIAPGQGQITSRGQNFDVNRKAYHFDLDRLNKLLFPHHMEAPYYI